MIWRMRMRAAADMRYARYACDETFTRYHAIIATILRLRLMPPLHYATMIFRF